VLALEFLPWRDPLKTLISLGAGASVLAGILFWIVAL
jgi:succinate dehydrogenase subunit D